MTSSIPPLPSAAAATGDERELRIDEIFKILWHGKWLLLFSALVLGGAVGVYAYLTPSLYKSQINLLIAGNKSGSQGSGSNGNRALGLLELGAVREASYTAIETTLHSHNLLSKVVTELHLNIAASPEYPNWRAAILARMTREQPLVHFSQFEAQAGLADQGLTLVAEGSGSYLIVGPDGEKLVRGMVGKPAVSSKTSSDGKALLSVQINDLEAKPGQKMQLSVMPVETAAQILSSRLIVNQIGNTSSNVISVALEGHDRKRLATVLNAVVQAYFQQSLRWRSEHLSEQLAFIKGQLPVLSQRVVDAQTQYNSYRARYGIVTVDADTQALLSQASNLETQTAALQVKAAGLRQQLGPNSTQLRSLLAEIGSIKQQRKQIDKQISELPDKQQRLAQLQLTLKSASDLYNSMLNASQELGIAKAGVVSDVRIIESAVEPDVPIAPHRSQLAAVGFLLGLIIGGGWLITRHLMRPEDTNPERVRRALGLPLAAVVPHAKKHRGGKPVVLATLDREHPALEALRNLRTELGLRHPAGANLLITSAGRADGKTTTALNLAWLLPDTGSRILLIDGDLRQGKLASAAGLEGGPGLTEVLLGEAKINEAIRPWRKGLDLLPAGRPAYRPSDLLARPLLGRLLSALREHERYDWIVIDSPPAADLTDAILLGAHCDAVYLVYRSGSNRLRAFRALVERLRDYKLPLSGLILNDDHEVQTTASVGSQLEPRRRSKRVADEYA